MRTYLHAKLHDLIVTSAHIDYQGSVGICRELLEAVAINPYERVSVCSLTTGARWETYAIPAELGQFTLNGPGAHLGKAGDRCVVLAWETYPGPYKGAKVVYCDERNRAKTHLSYPAATT